MKEEIQKRHNIARETSLKAGKDLLIIFRKELNVNKKENTGFVTAADILSSSIIFETISTAFPDDGYICEERA